MGLDAFRENMKIDRSIRKIVDFTNAKDCFPTASISGGVMYFLWNRDRQGLCNFKILLMDIVMKKNDY